jgi:membrane-associated phospholipid phosphatase
MALVYLMHFAGTLTLAFLLWLKDRSLFLRFAAVLLVLSYMQFITAILLPVAPPRYAWVYGEDLHVVDIAKQVGYSVGFHTLSWTYQHMNANPVAAMPSLHAAYPIAAALVVSARWPRLALGLVAYGAVVWFSIVYLGHHYVVDALGGALYAVIAYVLVRGVLTWASGRRRRGLVQLQLQPVPIGTSEPAHFGTVDRAPPEH